MITSIAIDSREPASITALEFGGIPRGVYELPCGDFMAATDSGHFLLFERKTTLDLLASIADGRLLSGVARMKEFTPWAYVLITGNIREGIDGYTVADGKKMNWDWASVQGALMTVQELGAVVIHCAGDHKLEDVILSVGKRNRDPERLVEPVAKAKFFSQSEQILCSLPSIGPARAAALLKDMGTVANVLEWLTAENSWTKVAGIGDGVKSSIRQTLGLGEGEEMHVSRTINVGEDFGWDDVRESLSIPF